VLPLLDLLKILAQYIVVVGIPTLDSYRLTALARCLFVSSTSSMHSFLALGLLVSTAAAAPAPQLVDLNPVYSKGNSSLARFRYYENPDSLQGPCDITTGPDANIWTQSFLDNSISKIEIGSGKITNYKAPCSPDQLYTNQSLSLTGRVAFACAIQPGSDGNLYAATGIRSQFLKINPVNGNIKVFTPPVPNVPFLDNIQPFNDLWDGGSGVRDLHWHFFVLS
jgi:hypothetical protein